MFCYRHFIFQYKSRFLFILKIFAEHFIQTICIWRFCVHIRRGRVKATVMHGFKKTMEMASNDISFANNLTLRY